MPRVALVATLQAVGARKRLVGADVCGEYSPPRHGNWLKRIESHLDQPARDVTDRQRIDDNRRIDCELARTLFDACAIPIMLSILTILLLLLGSVACDVSGQACFKPGVGHAAEGPGVPSLLHKALHSPWIAAGVAVYALEFVLWFAALSRAQPGFAFPIVALSYVGMVLASRFILNERISPRRRIGIGTIVVGVVLVTGQNLG